jgi:DNA-binding transcriptional MerR regulator
VRIGELARRAGTSPRSLRYYEQQGLLDSHRRDNGYREYDESAVVRVRNIRALLEAGLSCDEIGQLGECLSRDLTDEPICEPALALYRRRLRAVQSRIAELLDTHDRVRRALDQLTARAAHQSRHRPADVM